MQSIRSRTPSFSLGNRGAHLWRVSVVAVVAGVAMLALVACSGGDEDVTPASDDAPEATVASSVESSPAATRRPRPSPTPRPTSTPVPTRAPQATSTPVPTHTPTPVPAARYVIKSTDWELRGSDGEKMSVTLTMDVENQGGSAPEGDTPVYASINDGTAEVVTQAPALEPGATAPLLFNIRLDPGKQEIRVRIDESLSVVAMEILASDIVLMPHSYQVVDAGKVNFTVDVRNVGDIPTQPIAVVAGSQAVATIRPLPKDESERLAFVLELAPGAHQITVSAAADTREVLTMNNDAVFDVAIDYVNLQVEPLTSVEQGFNRDGSANMLLGFAVRNLGVAASETFTVGFRCVEDPDDHCAGEVTVGSLLPGEEFEGAIEATMPQGTVGVQLFAGELEHTYRYGPENVSDATIEVPVQPPVDIQFESATDVIGYYSDGTAAVNVTASLVNYGSEPVTDLRDVLISCRKDGSVIPGCSEVLELELTDGFGPVSSDVTLKVPPGQIMLNLDGGDVSGESPVFVPERVVGIDRAVWDCYRDDGGTGGFPRGNCGGRTSDVVQKWENGRVIKFWAARLPNSDANDRYIEVLEDVLAELAPTLNIEYEWVTNETEADVIARVGLSDAEARSQGFVECAGIWGCSTMVTSVDNSIASAEFVVLVNDDEPYASLGKTGEVVQYSMMHHLLSILGPLGYRDVPDSVMSADIGIRRPTLSRSDREIVDLLRHPLVKPGATLDEVGEMIVFTEDLVDEAEASEMTSLELIAEARSRLHEAGTALYELSGSWDGGECAASRDNFGPVQVTFGDFSGNRSRTYRMVAENERWFHLVSADRQDEEYWDVSPSSNLWRTVPVVGEQELVSSTAWSPEFSDPLVILASMLWFGRESQVEIVRSDDQERVIAIDLSSGFAAPEWASRSRLTINNMAIDSETYAIASFNVDWEFTVRGLSCDRYQVEARLVSYGSDLDVPTDIRDDSDILNPGN